MYPDETTLDEAAPEPAPAFVHAPTDPQVFATDPPQDQPPAATPPILAAALPADGVVHTITLAADASLTPPPDAATVAAQLADSIRAHIAHAGVVAQVAVQDAPPGEHRFSIRAADTSAARAAATAVIRAAAGRHWRYLGDGPDLATGDRGALRAVAD